WALSEAVDASAAAVGRPRPAAPACDRRRGAEPDPRRPAAGAGGDGVPDRLRRPGWGGAGDIRLLRITSRPPGDKQQALAEDERAPARTGRAGARKDKETR